MANNERILHVLAPAPFGGLERVVQMLSRGQAASGHVVNVAAVLDSGSEKTHPFPGEVGKNGVGVHVIPVPPRRYRLERRLVRDLCHKLNPTVLHLHGYRIDVLHAYLGRKLGIPVVTTVHGFTGGGWKGRFYEKLQVRSMRRMDAVVAVSPLLVGQLGDMGVPRNRIHLAMNGLDEGEMPFEGLEARRKLGVAEEGVRIGFVGRLSHEKGPDILLEALGGLPDRSVSLSFLGTGPQEEPLKDRALELGIKDRIEWHGRIDGAGLLLRAFDVLVLSSRTEGTPITLLEAMAAEIPVVASRVGGMPDVVSEEEALLVPSENPTELAAAIQSVLDDPKKAEVRTNRARRRLLAEFSMDPWVRRYDEVYDGAREVAEGRI